MKRNPHDESIYFSIPFNIFQTWVLSDFPMPVVASLSSVIRCTSLCVVSLRKEYNSPTNEEKQAYILRAEPVLLNHKFLA